MENHLINPITRVNNQEPINYNNIMLANNEAQNMSNLSFEIAQRFYGGIVMPLPFNYALEYLQYSPKNEYIITVCTSFYGRYFKMFKIINQQICFIGIECYISYQEDKNFLNEDGIKCVKALLNCGFIQDQIALMVGKSQSIISDIKNDKY